MAPDSLGSSAIPVPVRTGSDAIAPDCRGQNFWRIDRGFQDVLSLYLDPAQRAHFEPHFDRMGAVAGGRLDELAATADKNGPVLHPRDRFGRDEDWIDYHPAYREMERIAWSDFGMAAMSHRGGVLGWPTAVSPLVKYGFTYLFVQAEFGIMCPISVSDTSTYMIQRYGDAALKARYADMMSTDMDTVLKGTQFMTEKAGGSDVGTNALTAVRDGDHWRLHGDKWFCSHADADVGLVLARPEGAPPGTRGLGLFAVPRRLDDGTRNSYRIVRLKDKLGTKSMASGEIIFDGALAYVVGDVNNGLKQMMSQVNLSRLSHGVRAAAMMRRCLNEAMQVANYRVAFRKRLIDHPLMRRSLMKLMLPTEQALSVYGFAAAAMERANNGDAEAAKVLRITTPLFKFRACRDNVPVATGAMEVRGGLGYIEEWVNARLVRDAQIGLLWEGTSNINGLDVVMRAVAKERAHEPLRDALHAKLQSGAVPSGLRTDIGDAIDRAVALAETVGSDPKLEHHARRASSALYHAMSAALMAWEGAELGQRGGDARRLLLARLVLQHRLGSGDPLAMPEEGDEEAIVDALLDGGPVSLERAVALLG